MAKLTTHQRATMKKSKFGLPENVKEGPRGGRKTRGAFPMPDKAHARAAIRLAPYSEEKGNISKSQEETVIRKAHRVLGKSKKRDGEVRHPQSHEEFEKLGR